MAKSRTKTKTKTGSRTRTRTRSRTARGPGGAGGIGGIDGINEIDWLSGITVRRLEAIPSQITPFGSATLHWDVDAGPPVALRLGGLRVLHDGSMAVQPTESFTYRLFAYANNDSRELGQVSVAVLHNQCVWKALENIDDWLAAALALGVQQSGKLYFRILRTANGYAQAKPEVTVGTNRIDFKLKLAAEVDWVPNPDVDVSGSFGIAVVPVDDFSGSVIPKTKLAASNVDVRVDVTFPWYAYAIPVAPIGLPIAASMAEDSARAAFTEGVERFVELLNIPSPVDGYVKHGTRLFTDDFGAGILEVEFCPPPVGGVVLDNP